MGNEIILYGAGGHCKVIIDILECLQIEIRTIVHDNPFSTILMANSVVSVSNFSFRPTDNVIISIGNNKIRKKLSKKLNVTFEKVIHPKASFSKHSSMGEGTVIMAGAIVSPNVKIGKHCIINSSAVVEHDCIIEDFAHVCPSASLAGGVLIGEGTQVGIGATIIQNVIVGNWVVIGAGTVVLNNVPDYSVVVGNPGKVIRIEQND
ncbi:MAG: acetyltransferase [Flavobacterium sp.]|jgi:sugar O-acyltransferase (sialic acid O-acetyltransferase NeuD family)